MPAKGCGEAEARLFLDEMQSRVGSSISFELTLVDELAGNARGKRAVVDQRLDLAQFAESGSSL